MKKPTQILVLGGRGFLGRYIVQELNRCDVRLIIGSRMTKKHTTTSTGRYENFDFSRLSSVWQWRKQVRHFDVVINCVGILRPQRYGSYESIHHKAVGLLASACCQEAVRLVHISALGIDQAVSDEFMLSKRRGEQAIKAAGGDYHIVRPSLVDGVDGYGAGWFRRLAAWPVHPRLLLPKVSISPLLVTDLASAVCEIALAESAFLKRFNRLYELGGVEHFQLHDYLVRLKGKSPIAQIPIPAWLSLIVARLCDTLNLTPFSVGHRELLHHNNVPTINALADLLRRQPRTIQANTSLATIFYQLRQTSL